MGNPIISLNVNALSLQTLIRSGLKPTTEENRNPALDAAEEFRAAHGYLQTMARGGSICGKPADFRSPERERWAAQFERKVAAAEKIKNPADRAVTLLSLAQEAAQATRKKRALRLFERSLTAAEVIADPSTRLRVFQLLDDAVIEAKLGEKKISLQVRIIAGLKKEVEENLKRNEEELKRHEEELERKSEELVSVLEDFIRKTGQLQVVVDLEWAAGKLATLGLGEKAIPLFEQIVAYAREIENSGDRARLFLRIAAALEKAGLKGRVSLPNHP